MRAEDEQDAVAPLEHSSDFQLLYAVRGEYQTADTKQTVGEALREYYEVNPGLSNPLEIEEPKSARYFYNHDYTHVIFGTHTGPLDEGVNDLFTFFGVDVRYLDYIGGFFATKESSLIIEEYQEEYSLPSLFKVFVQTVRLLPKIRRTCRAMSKRWPWDPQKELLDQSLAQVRSDFGIKLWRPEIELGIEPRSRGEPSGLIK